MVALLTTAGLSLAGILWCREMLLWTAAFFNVWLWVWLVSYAVTTLWAVTLSRHEMAAEPLLAPSPPPVLLEGATEPVASAVVAAAASAAPVAHLIVLPNYKEDVETMGRTIQALAEAQGADTFRVLLAMEAREGPPAEDRARQLIGRFAGRFASLSAAYHPVCLHQSHPDGSECNEIPGKSSNLRWAVRAGFEECVQVGIRAEQVVLTVADADCIFHPAYFARVGSEFQKLSLEPGSPQFWTMWQAPQLLFRNYWAAPAPSRIWGYISSMYEFGGCGRLTLGGFHMTFSSFSLSLELVLNALPWDGDVIADDHHCYLKCFLYSIWHGADQLRRSQPPLVDVGDAGVDDLTAESQPMLRVRPVMLPVKSTSVVAEGCLASWKARFNQAVRHSQGVAELSYILMGVWSLCCSLPTRSCSCWLVYRVWRVVLIPLCINLLPILQSIPFAVVTVYWLSQGGQIPECPSSTWGRWNDHRFYLCAGAGGWNLGLPMLIPMLLVSLTSYCMLLTAFVTPAREPPPEEVEALELGKERDSVWHEEDGGIPTTFGSKRLSLAGMVVLDCCVLLAPVMSVYGALPAVMAYWNCMVRGNRFEFVSAAKLVSSSTAPRGDDVKHSCPHTAQVLGAAQKEAGRDSDGEDV